MSSGENHVFATVFLLVIIYFVFPLQIGDFVGLMLAMFIGALAPDWFDPPKSYTHRKFFHSKKLLLWISVAVIITLLISMLAHWMIFVSFILIGYVSHLLLDWTTKMGLPD